MGLRSFLDLALPELMLSAWLGRHGVHLVIGQWRMALDRVVAP